jgi:hypothetical protein
MIKLNQGGDCNEKYPTQMVVSFSIDYIEFVLQLLF